MTTYTRTIPCVVNFTHNPAEQATTSEPWVDEEFFVDSIKLNGVELSEFLTDDMEDKLYEILKGINYD